MPIGRSRWGFFDSSALVATTSKPMKAKNTSAAPAKIPPTPNAPGEIPMSWASVVPELPPGAGLDPDGGMNGCRFFECTYDRPAMMTRPMIASLIATITALTVLEVRIPEAQQAGDQQHDHRGEEVVVIAVHPARHVQVPRARS